MKIIFLINDITRSGGTERITTTLCNSFCRHGHEIIIVSNCCENGKPYFSLDENINVRYLHRKRASIGNKIGRVINYFKTPTLLKKELVKFLDYDLIIGQTFPMNFILYLCTQGKKSIACEHIYFAYYNIVIRKLRNIIYRSFDKVVVLTDSDKTLFERQIHNVETIPNMAYFPSSHVKSTLSEKLIVSVGRLEQQKGFDLLIQASQEVFRKHPDWRLNIFGDGALRNELEKNIRKKSLENHVFLMGRTAHIDQEYLKSSIFVLSSRFEGFGLVLIEAAAFGLPIISFDCPSGPADILAGGKGILVPLGDVKSLSLQMCEMIEYPERRNYYAEKGNSIILNYSEEKIYKHWDMLFRGLLNRV